MKISNKFLANHLRSMTQEELIDLVIDFAPDHYRQAVGIAQASSKQQEEGFARVRKKVENLFWGAYPTYEQIDQMMVEAILPLRSFWKIYPMEVLFIYRDLAVRMHTAQEDGDLYDRMQDVYMETGWGNEVVDFLDQLADHQKELAVIELNKIRESLEWISATWVIEEE